MNCQTSTLSLAPTMILPTFYSVEDATRDSKLTYLTLFELPEPITFSKLRDVACFDSVMKLMKSLKRLMAYEFVYPNHTLMTRKMRDSQLSKLKSIHIEVMNRTPEALHWALTDVEEPIRGKTSDWYYKEMCVYAKMNRAYILEWDVKRDLIYE